MKASFHLLGLIRRTSGPLFTCAILSVLAFASVAPAAEISAPLELRLLAPGEEPPPPTQTGVKWYPGHYAFVPDPSSLESRNAELAPYSIVRGFQTRFFWDELETGLGQYDFSKVLDALNFAKSQGKFLVVQIQFKTFNDTKRVPRYLLNAEYEGGVYEASSGGWNLRLWNTNVLSRFKMLIHALGAALDSHGSLALVNLAESAAGAPYTSDPLSGNWSTLARQHATNLASVADDLRGAFPTTPTIMYFNGGTPDASVFKAAVAKSGTGLGGPDTYIGAYDLNLFLRYSYDLAREVSESVPLGFAVQWNNFVWLGASSKYVHPNGAVPVDDIFSFSRDTLKSNFIFWDKRDPHWTEVKALFDRLGKEGDISGGLRTACPKMLKCAE